MNLQEHKKQMMQNPEFKKEYERFDLWFELQELWLVIRTKIKIWLKI